MSHSKIAKESWDVIVIGAGAAGLYAAATAAARGRSTLLIEKNKKLGVKILMSGGTRCNITQDTTWQGISEAFGKRQGRFLKFALATLPPEEVVKVFNECGVATKVEATGKIFPDSDKAIDVRDALVERARNSGVTILRETSVVAIERLNLELPTRRLQVLTESQRFQCDSVILTTGGQSYPGCGTTGDGYDWLKHLGHEVLAARPALTPIRIGDQWVRDLSGVTITDVGVGVRVLRHENAGAKEKGERNHYRGSFLFTHKGCSGPSVLNVSRVVTDPQNNFPKQLVCDWLPDVSEDQLRSQLTSDRLKSSGKQVGNFFAHQYGQQIPKRLLATICDQANVPLDRSLAELGRKSLAKLLQRIKMSEMEVAGTLGFAKAEVTAGGVELTEVDNKTMASKLVPGLFLAGEILDVDGPIGGYNFQAAFSTGFVAGSNA